MTAWQELVDQIDDLNLLSRALEEIKDQQRRTCAGELLKYRDNKRVRPYISDAEWTGFGLAAYALSPQVVRDHNERTKKEA